MFQYPEDKEFFMNFLAGGDEALFEQKFKRLFDFRDPEIKRVEFNLIRNSIFEKLVAEHGKVCQLRLLPNCMESGEYHVDHLIPLSTNELNKKLRHMKRTMFRKAPTQSFGSNDIANLQIACKECNNYKKHRVMKSRSANEIQNPNN